jgi:hypothetical protein
MSDDNVTNNEGGGDDPFAALVGEGKKFATPQDLARGKQESDAFISKILDENKALRTLINQQEDNTRSNQIMEELLNRVSQSTLGREEQGANQQPTPASNQSEKPVTSKDVAEIFKVMKKAETEQENLTKALSQVKGKYGDKTDEVLKSRAVELGLDLDMLLATAKRSPNAFLTLLGENREQPSAASVKGSINSQAVINSTHGAVRNKAYYDKMQAEMGVRKFVMDTKIQTQMHRDMMDLGDAWDGG